MAQRVIIITGASDGIGAAAARQLAVPGNRLILVGRSPEKTATVARAVGAESFTADFARLDDVRRLAADIRGVVDHIDVLANNAGGVFGPRTLTVDGNEQTLAVNHLAPFLLTNLLVDLLRRGEGVVINTSSSAAKIFGDFDGDDLQNAKSFNQNRAYGDAKLNNVLFTRGLNSGYAGPGITSVAFDPGNVATNFASETDSFMRFVYRTPIRKLALISPEKGGANLAFFIDGRPGSTWDANVFYTQTAPARPNRTNPQIFDEGNVRTLWEQSATLVGLPHS